MKLTKKRIVSALLMVLLLFTFTACGEAKKCDIKSFPNLGRTVPSV